VLVDRGHATVTLFSDGQVVDSATVQSDAGLALFNAGDVLPFYNGAAIVEVSESPSAAGQLLLGEGVLAGSSCEQAAKEAYLVGGSTGPDLALAVRLYNPLLESGIVELSVTTEFGLEPLLDFDRVVVAPRSWVDVPIDRVLGERTSIAVRATVAEGVVIAAFVSDLAGGSAIWNGAGLAQRWEFPATVAGTGTSVAVWNPNEETVTVAIASYDSSGLVDATEIPVGPQREERVPLATDGGAIVIQADAAVAAAVTYEGERGHAGTTGLAQSSQRWLIPVVGSQPPDADAWIGLFNGEDQEATVLVRPLGSGQATQLTVPAGAAAGLAAPGVGLEVTSDFPITVGWRLGSGSESALGRGVPVR
jgi:hypothetical protein